MIEMAQKIDNRFYERQLERKGGTSSNHWTQKKSQKKNYWPQPMELDATFKTGGRPRNPNKERQLKERLCFNCNKPGHMARDCKQPKKENGKRKFGKQLNATWQGQLNATFMNKPDWGIRGDSTSEDNSDDEVDLDEFDASLENENGLMNKGLTESQKSRLQKYKEEASPKLFKEQLRGFVETMKESMLRNPEGAQHTELEATSWLKYRLAEYEALDVQEDFEKRWKLHEHQASMNYETADEDVDDLRKTMAETTFANEEEGKGLEQRNVAEIDHPWHQYMEWSKCYDGLCYTHYHDKEKNQHYPQNKIPVYYSWSEMREIV
ncbi:hypothetical protein GMDG_00796 [Pseudogymnoascus destructans 20631-21]|uniref:CCHC-type domain-containing protein n=1 Tax=Pseudogymnoascus destructans (strain ATCC MYA-4855 / 20631-21) TaxID=658429 RepID=L8GCH7_PSED2|nr:hypothetical protein GMDG_00796 [Pseudogymnoascus destructans 20631-21]